MIIHIYTTLLKATVKKSSEQWEHAYCDYTPSMDVCVLIHTYIENFKTWANCTTLFL